MVPIAFLSALLLALSAGAQLSTVVGNLPDAIGVVNSSLAYVKFIPGQALAQGTNTWLTITKPAAISNGVFSVLLPGPRFYSADFGAANPRITILVPATAGVYQFNDLANLAVNAAMFPGLNMPSFQDITNTADFVSNNIVNANPPLLDPAGAATAAVSSLAGVNIGTVGSVIIIYHGTAGVYLNAPPTVNLTVGETVTIRGVLFTVAGGTSGNQLVMTYTYPPEPTIQNGDVVMAYPVVSGLDLAAGSVSSNKFDNATVAMFLSPGAVSNIVIGMGTLTNNETQPTTFNSTVTATSFSGSGAGLTGLPSGSTVIGTAIVTNQSGIQLQSSTANKTIVVVGDSIAQGSAADTGKGWVDLFTTMMQARGWTVYNEAVGQMWVNDLFGGLTYPTTTTGHAAKDFYSRVLSHNPNIVVNAMEFNDTSPSSSPTGSPGIIASQGNTNSWATLQLAYCRLLQQYGIQPVFCKTKAWAGSPYNYYNEESVRLSWADQMESQGIPMIDFMDAVAELRDNVPAVMYDSLHPNNLGHALMFSAISPQIFDAPWQYGPAWRKINQFRPKTALRILLPTIVTSPQDREVMVYAPTYAMSNFTFSVWVRNWGNYLGYGTVMSARGIYLWPSGSLDPTYYTDVQVVENKASVGSYHLLGGTSYSPTAMGGISLDYTNDNWTHLALTYSAAAKNVNAYVNGTLYWSFNNGDITYTNVHFCLGGSRAAASQYTDYAEAAVYRVCLVSNEVARLANHQYQLAGLEVFCPFDDQSFTANVPINNLAPSHEPGFAPVAAGTAASMKSISTAAPERLPVYPFAPIVNTSGGLLWVSNQTPNLYYTTTNSSGVGITTLK